MFHTFEGFQNPNPRPTNARSRSRDGQGTSGRRSSTVRACEQCRRRKIRCDGEQPCEACQWYKKADLCQYSDPRPSRRHVEKLSSALDEYKNVVEKLFPSIPIESLTTLPRDKLLEMISEARPAPPQRAPSPTATSPVVENPPAPLSPEDENLESLQTMPEESGDSRESPSPDLVAGVSDDVNALSLSSKQPSTYLGISSVLAVMRVILWIAPDSASYFSRTPDRQSRIKREYSLSSSDKSSWQSQFSRPSAMPSQPPPPPVQSNSLQLINAYFAYFHSFIPLLDEASFRETFRTGKRNDGRWLGLLNMVFALGSIAAYTADDTSHDIYYRRSRQYVNFDSLGSAHLETVQTLALMGGYYLHYVSQPNLSNALMGAALRMATTLGLHREFIDNRGVSPKTNASLDLRRRVWWSLFCLDTWGYMTLGRPSMGRFGQGITAKFPQYSGDRENALGILPLVENSRFCKIATQVGDALAASPLVNYAEMTSLDNQLVEWYNNLPPLLKMHEPCPDTVSTTRTIMRWRYQNMRILLHRPVLLSYAMRRIPYVAIRAEERVAIEKCRQVADETIRDISSATRLNQMSGWNAVWLIFQATLVPLLGLFIADNTAVDATASIDSCRTQVEIAMIALARMQSWSPTSKRTLEVVSRMLEASRRNPDDTSTPSSRDRAASTSTQSVGAAGTPAPGMQGNQNHPGAFSYQQPMDPMNTMIPLTEDASQNMWDYLTWSDSNLWAGFGGDPALRQEGLAAYGADEEFLKHHDPMAVSGGLYETGYIPSDNNIAFQ